MKKALQKNRFKFTNTICLELGPGRSSLDAYNCLMNGARLVYLVDKYPRKMISSKEYVREIQFMKKKFHKNPAFLLGEGRLDDTFIKLIPRDVSALKSSVKVDLLFSFSVMEHIKEVERNIQKFHNLLKKDGLMYHSIDLRDHYNFNDPFLFYKYSDKTWNEYLVKEGVTYTNRLRYDDYISLFEKHDFKIVEEHITKYPLPSTSRLSKKFRTADREMLRIGIVRLLLKKL
ncbi:MAG: class I SAM-dependent methyltransferase [archaeon]